jgi:hypothetical protein
MPCAFSVLPPRTFTVPLLPDQSAIHMFAEPSVPMFSVLALSRVSTAVAEPSRTPSILRPPALVTAWPVVMLICWQSSLVYSLPNCSLGQV